jgi:hypothetical protein
MATDLGMSAPAPSTFLSSKTLSYESNQPYKKIFQGGKRLRGTTVQSPLSEVRGTVHHRPNRNHPIATGNDGLHAGAVPDNANFVCVHISTKKT